MAFVGSNYFDCPLVIKDSADYWQIIDSVKEYTKRFYSIKKISEESIPFPLKFILNLLSCIKRIIHKVRIDPHLPFFAFFDNYIEGYFLKHYKPKQIPFIYAIIQEKKGMLCNQTALYKRKAQKSIKHWSKALEYLNIYDDQRFSNRLSEYSKIVQSEFEKKSSFTMLKGAILGNLTAAYDPKTHRLQKIETMNKSLQYFINDHREYSVYSDYGHVGLDFVMRLIQRLSSWDYHKGNKYQKRYSILLKIAMKSLVKYYGNSGHLYAEKYGQLQICLGSQYVLFQTEQTQQRANFCKAQKLISDGIDRIKKYDKYSMMLRDAYDFLLWIDQSLCDIDHWRKVLKMSMDFNKHYGLSNLLQYDEEDLNELRRMQHWSRYRKLLYLKSFWNEITQSRKETSMKCILDKDLSGWIGYFKDNHSYHVLKNLCYLKECNYSECRAKDKELEVCSKCKSVYYCCRNHQKRDWKSKHRGECREYQQRNAFLTFKRYWEAFTVIPMNDKLRLVEML